MIGVFVFSLGLCVGSFLNVCIWRLQRGQELIWSRSRCPGCGGFIAFYDNIPILSFLLLAGRCRHCGKRISFRYPAVESLTGILAWGLWRRWEGQGPWFVAAFAASAALVVVAFIDWDTFLIPDVLSLGLLALGVPSALCNPYFSGSGVWRVGASAFGALVGFLVCWATAALGEKVFKKEAMGGGDVKLLTAIGAWIGAWGAIDVLLLASLLGLFYSAPLMLRGKLKRQDPIPFGPFLSAGAIFEFFYWLPVLRASLSLTGWPLGAN